MRILTLCYEYPPIGGGGAKVVAGLTKTLADQGNHVDLVTMAFQNLPRYQQLDGVDIYRVPCMRRKASICHPHEMASYIWKAQPLLTKLTRQSHYDINHTHFIFPDGVLAYRIKQLTGLPYVITAHGSDVPGYNPNRFKLLHVLMKPIWQKIVKEADGIASPSQFLSHLIQKNLPGKHASVIPNGFNSERFNSNIHQPDRVLVVSRIFERKGIQYLIRALEGMDAPIQVDIVGSGPHLDSVKEITRSIHSAATIVFHEWLENDSPQLQALYEQAGIFVFPSEAENFPIVLLEAMAAGLAIITTKDTGCAEVVGEAALLVEPRNPQAIRLALQSLIDQPDLQTSLGEAARERVNSHFSWPNIASQYIALYQKAIQQRRA
ncbi:MAG: glycosyltransferase family 4 protein [Anaerolineales bacterium]|nr:glycosyltransferase family 4 protein [Anaerolineales bacterium]